MTCWAAARAEKARRSWPEPTLWCLVVGAAASSPPVTSGISLAAITRDADRPPAAARFQSSFLWMATGKREPSDITRPLSSIGKRHVRFVQESVLFIDTDKKRVTRPAATDRTTSWSSPSGSRPTRGDSW